MVGMFSVGLDMYSYHGETISSSLRSVSTANSSTASCLIF